MLVPLLEFNYERSRDAYLFVVALNDQISEAAALPEVEVQLLI